MKYLLLLVNAEGGASARELSVRQLREFPGAEGVSVHFRPVRNDALFRSAKVGSEIAYRMLLGEGIVRSQLWVEYEVGGSPINVTGSSADLLFALALTTSRWMRAAGEHPSVAATGVLSADEALVSPDRATGIARVGHIESKIAAAIRALAGEREGVVIYPAADRERVEKWCAATAVPPHIRIEPVATLDEALSVFDIRPEKVYLGNPYRGLEYFDYAHRAVFFGREGEVRDCIAQLLRREAAGVPGILVEGASGSGKSSFLRAGIVPALVNSQSRPPELRGALAERPVSPAASRAVWHPALLPVGADEDAFARSIRRAWLCFPELSDDLFSDTSTFDGLLRSWRSGWTPDRRFVWLIDQLEELFNLEIDSAVIESFGHFLLALQAMGAWSLASIRADGAVQLKRFASLRAVFGANEGQYYLAGLGPTALDDVICRPAKAASLTFGVSSGGRRLDQTLREDAYRDPENALPLLQLTLHELYRRRCGRELTYGVYEELGGLSGAVSTIVSAALKHLSQSTAGATSRLFRNLVTVDESGAAVRRYALRSEIAEDPEQERMLVALVNARLCASDQREGIPVVALAHETVLRTWPELVEWLKQESRLLQLRDIAERDARLWRQHGQSDAWLAQPSKLTVLQPLEVSGIRLPETVRQFIKRSHTRVLRTTRLKQAGVAAAIMLAITASVAGVIAVSKQRDAEYQTARALHARDQATIEAGAARATARFLAAIFNAPTPERSLGRPITARELLDAGARRLRTSLVAAPEVRARLTEQVGNAYRELGEYDRAAPLLESAIDQYHTLRAAPVDDQAEAYTALGRLYRATGETAKARSALNEAMALEAEVAAARRSAMPNLVYAHIETVAMDFPAAAAALAGARAILRNRTRPPDRENYLILMRYSRLYIDEGKPERAERYGLQAFATESRILGPADPAAINAAVNLEVIYQQTGKMAAAEKYGRHALALAKRLYGVNNPVYAKTLGYYAINFGATGRNKEAEKLFRQVLAIRLRTLGPHHRDTGTAYYDIATAVAAQGRWSKALNLFRRARRIWEASDGRDSPSVAWALAMEAKALTHLGRPEGAVPLALRSLRISEHALGPTHSYVAEAWQELGGAYLALGRYTNAVDALHRAIVIVEPHFGNSKEFAKLLDAYAKALRGARRFTEARAALARAATIRARHRVVDASRRLASN